VEDAQRLHGLGGEALGRCWLMLPALLRLSSPCIKREASITALQGGRLSIDCD
jgi:hypothetical protein